MTWFIIHYLLFGYNQIVLPLPSLFDSWSLMDHFSKRQQLGKRIALIRKARHLSQKQLSFMAGINNSYLSEVENGLVNISIDKLFDITEALGVSLSTLLEDIG